MRVSDDNAHGQPGLTFLVEEPRTAIDGFKIWLIRLPVVLAFLLIGLTKFDSDPRGEWVRIFERIGWGQWFRYLTGVMQTAGALLLLSRKTRTLGTLMLGATMIGAAIVDVVVIHAVGYMLAPLVLLGAVVVVWFGGRE